MAVIAALVALSLAAPAVAQASAVSNQGLIRTGATDVLPGQSVGDIIVVGHDLTIGGTADHVLVVNGNVDLLPSARVDTVIDLGGEVRTLPGATVHKLLHATLGNPFWSGAIVAGLGALLMWMGMLAAGIVLTAILTVIAAALRESIEVPLAELEKSARRAGLSGVFVTLAVLALSGLLAATLVGIPVAVVCLALYAVGAIVGLSVVSVWLGRMIAGRDRVRDVWKAALAGVSFIVAFSSIPIIGQILFLVLWLAGVGVTAEWLWRWRHRRKASGART
ncbi:hypothetical protein SAMN05421799_10123 [Alicyclobacillus vulcanalis]|uniref:DUF8173 domain-containing protein n=1 Tax=Alicyclobacillus vulcanalis TaxID=252246 RepID=A0A1N7JK08_9BACL|nr:hypothetical protein SAMN05421799_10123 [Alicyclobacillus vulcanalis]